MRSYLALLFIALLTIIGCSGSGGTQPTQPQYPMRDFNLDNGHSVYAVGDIAYQPGSKEVTVIPNRALELHYNVTGMLNDPNCPGSQCVLFVLTGADPTTSFPSLHGRSRRC